VVSIGPAALQFMLRSRADLWPEMAVVFASVDPETVAREQLPDGVTGLVRRRSIVEAHGGRLSAAPAHPHGTVFQIFLPVGIAGAA
jgi:K+-sensing histidine kinase KdpD